MNNVCLIGNLTKDPEVKTTQSGHSVCSFSIAVNRRMPNAQGERETDFINCVAWRGTADFIGKYFSKGKKMALTGALQVRNYVAQDGTKRYATEVIVDNAEFVERKQDGVAQDDPTVDFVPADDIELPF